MGKRRWTSCWTVHVAPSTDELCGRAGPDSTRGRASDATANCPRPPCTAVLDGGEVRFSCLQAFQERRSRSIRAAEAVMLLQGRVNPSSCNLRSDPTMWRFIFQPQLKPRTPLLSWTARDSGRAVFATLAQMETSRWLLALMASWLGLLPHLGWAVGLPASCDAPGIR